MSVIVREHRESLFSFTSENELRASIFKGDGGDVRMILADEERGSTIHKHVHDEPAGVLF